jgi:cathepsin D
MGYPALAESNVKPVFDEIMGQSLLKNNIFSFYVGSNPEMTMGYYDKSKFKGDIHWNPVEFKYMYGIKLDDIKVNGKRLGVCEGA